MDHRARVLDIRSASGILSEMAEIGVHTDAAEWLADKSRVHPVRLEAVPGPAAALLKQ